MPDDRPPLTSDAAEAVRALARMSRLLEHSCAELSLAHYRVLAAVAGGDERASRVARRLALGKPAISASVDALCRRGLLERTEATDDQRATALRLTAAGRSALQAGEAAMIDRLEAVLAHTVRPAGTCAALARLGTGLDHFHAARAR